MMNGLSWSPRTERLPAMGGTDHHFDPGLDAYQVLGVIPAWVLGRLWSGFVPQDNEVSINPAYVRRHMQKAPEYVQRVASFAQHAHELPRLFARAIAFARYDGVKEGEAGLTVYAPVDAGDGSTQYLAIGVKRSGYTLVVTGEVESLPSTTYLPGGAHSAPAGQRSK